jgi:amino acid adenylation domain-containing protein
VVFGTVLIGGSGGSADGRPALGLFINMLPVRIALDDLSAADLVSTTQRKLAMLMAHDQASLADAQRCSGVVAGPLFTSVLNYRHGAVDFEAEWGRARGVRMLAYRDRTNYPITFSVDDLASGFLLTAQTTSQLAPAVFVEFMREALSSLVGALESESSLSALRLPLLPPYMQEYVIRGVNSTRVECNLTHPVHVMFETQVERTPDASAVEYAGRALTYAEINSRANQLARYLRSQGVGSGELVGVCVNRSLEMIIGVLAALKAGAAYLPLDPNYPEERLQYMIEDGAPCVVLVDREPPTLSAGSRSRMLAITQVLVDAEEYSGANVPLHESHVTPQDPVYVIYTSGSTGRPKGTVMGHRSMSNLIEWHQSQFAPGHRVLQFAALSFDVAFQEVFSTLCTGSTLLLLDEWTRRDPAALTEFLSRHAVERLFLPPLMLQGLAESFRSTGRVPTGLKDIITAGEQLQITPEIVALLEQLPDCKLHNHYGPTETHVVTALTLEGEPKRWPKIPTIGTPVWNTSIYLLDKLGQPVPAGATGEIYIGGTAVARGYLRRPDMTAQRFLCDPFSDDPAARMYSTGDLGRWRADGTLEYLGRSDAQVKIRGYRVELGEIEALLARHPGVREVAVVARQDPSGGRRLVAYVTRRDGASSSIDELHAHVRAALPEYMLPSGFVFLERMPTTPSGKLDRRALPAPDQDAYLSRSYEPPQGDLEQTLADLWCTLLGVERVGREDSFFELGGHSLTAMKLAAMLADTTGIHLPISAVFRHPTLRRLAEALRTSPTDSGACNEAMRRLNRAPLSYSQLQHVSFYRLTERPAMRHLAFATRLRGTLNLAMLRTSIETIVQRHEALRSRIVLDDGVLVQEIDPEAGCPIRLVDLSRIPQPLREREARKQIEALIEEPIDIAVGPLFETCLLKMAADCHVLVVVMEHLIGDMWSLDLMLRETFTAYSQLVSGQPVSLPAVGIQFSDYASWQRRQESAWLEAHGNYWKGRLKEDTRLRFPIESKARVESATDAWDMAPISIDATRTAELNSWCQANGTTPALAIFTAYAVLVLRRCDVTDTVIRFETNGRTRREVENTIGYFAAPLYLRVQLAERDTLLDVLRRIIDEYCAASDHADSSYLEARVPRPEYSRNTAFNWVPERAEIAGIGDLAGLAGLESSLVPFVNPLLSHGARDTEPFVLFGASALGTLGHAAKGEDAGARHAGTDRREGIVGGLYFPVSRFSSEMMNGLAANLVQLIDKMIADASCRVSEIRLINPSRHPSV